MKTGLLFLALLISTYATTDVFATELNADSAADEAAKEAFERGSALFSEEKYAEAATAFREAYQARPTWKLFYNIGQAETAATHYGLGLVAFENYLAQGGDKVPVERSQEVLAEIKRLRELVGSLDVAAPPHCIIRINGEVRGTTPLTGLIKIAAGIPHHVVVELDGDVLHEQTIRVSGGDERLIRVLNEQKEDVPAAPSEADAPTEPVVRDEYPVILPPTPTVPPSKNKLKPIGVVLLGTGVATMLAGGITGAMAFGRSSNLDADCPDNVCAENGAVDDMYTSQTMGTVSTILFAAGGAITAAGIVVLIAGKKRTRETPEKDAPVLSVLPAASRSFNGILFKGRF